MAFSFDLLPTELQASVAELRAAGVAASVIDTLVERTLAALVTKSNKVQVQVFQIEERLGLKLEQIGLSLQADLQSQHGETNTMLLDLNTAWLNTKPMIEEAGRGIAEIKKLWEELSSWRGRVETALAGLSEFRRESTTDRQGIRDAVADQNTRHGQQIAELIGQFRAFDTRLEAIEQLLEIAGNHEAGS